MPPPVSTPARSPATEPLVVPVAAMPAMRARRRPSLWVVALVLAGIVGAVGTKALVGEVYSVPSGSMAETITAGQRIAIEKLSYDFRDPRRGEVIVFDGHGIFVDPAPGVHMFVKRVVGLGGDRVRCCDSKGRLSVNAVTIDESQYLDPGQVPSAVSFDVTVPPASMWVMGDHRATSADSRAYLGSAGGGFVPIDRVTGRAVAVVWPWSNAHLLPVPTSFAAVDSIGPGSGPGVAGS